MSDKSTESMNTENIFTFYKQEIDEEFSKVWSMIADSHQSSDSFDIRLECSDGRYCHGHQSLLAISSRCFREAIDLYSTKVVPENEELVIELPDSVQFDELYSIIDYIYKGFVSVPESRLNNFLETSRCLAINGLEDINLVSAEDLNDFNQVLIANQSILRCKPEYVFHFQESDESESPDSSDGSSNLHLEFKDILKIEELDDRGLPIVSKNPVYGQSLIGKPNKPRKAGFQGRKPQIGSPLITDEFKYGDRYQCQVCFRSYLWKKSLVRHYKDLHPNDIALVS